MFRAVVSTYDTILSVSRNRVNPLRPNKIYFFRHVIIFSEGTCSPAIPLTYIRVWRHGNDPIARAPTSSPFFSPPRAVGSGPLRSRLIRTDSSAIILVVFVVVVFASGPAACLVGILPLLHIIPPPSPLPSYGDFVHRYRLEASATAPRATIKHSDLWP